MSRHTPAIRLLALLAAWTAAGCSGERQVSEGPLLPSAAAQSLGAGQPPEIFPAIAAWHPADWRVHFLQGMLAGSHADKVAHLRRADSLRPGEPCIAYHLALAHLEAAWEEGAGPAGRAAAWAEKALRLDPANGVFEVLHAFVLAEAGEAPRARGLLRAEDFHRGGFCFERVEEILLGLFSHADNFHPYALLEMSEIYRAVPLPPFERLTGVLRKVFLDPLEQRPYDIRIRGGEAAIRLYNLGRRLRTDQGGSRLFSDGYERRTLGYVLQLKAGEFLVLFHRAFGDTLESRRVYAAVANLQGEYLRYLEGEPWRRPEMEEYLAQWDRLAGERPDLLLAQADSLARSWHFWRQARRSAYPDRDDPAVSRPGKSYIGGKAGGTAAGLPGAKRFF